jgi:hypothetical protein
MHYQCWVAWVITIFTSWLHIHGAESPNQRGQRCLYGTPRYFPTTEIPLWLTLELANSNTQSKDAQIAQPAGLPSQPFPQTPPHNSHGGDPAQDTKVHKQ